MESIKIEKGIPVPGQGYGRWRSVAEKMEKGDSIVTDRKGAYALVAAITKLRLKASFRKLEDNKYRVWRVE